MIIHPIKVAFDNLPSSIKNTAEDYVEGRNILIYCLSRESKRSEMEIIDWLKENNIKVTDLDGFTIRDMIDDSDRIK